MSSPSESEIAPPPDAISSTVLKVTLLFLLRLRLRCSCMCVNSEIIRPGSDASFCSISLGSLVSKRISWNSFRKNDLAVSRMFSTDSLNFALTLNTNYEFSGDGSSSWNSDGLAMSLCSSVRPSCFCSSADPTSTADSVSCCSFFYLWPSSLKRDSGSIWF